MALILYVPVDKKLSDRLLQSARCAAGADGVEMVCSLDKLKVRLQKPLCNVGIAVICVESGRDLMDILHVCDRLGGLRVVLLFAEDQEDLLEKVRLLRPHFVLAMEEDFKYLDTTLKRMTDVLRMIQW